MSTFVIEHAEGSRFLTPWGWSPRPEHALRFTSFEEADSHRQNDPVARHGRTVPAELREDAAGNSLPPDIRTDYNPFGFGR